MNIIGHTVAKLTNSKDTESDDIRLADARLVPCRIVASVGRGTINETVGVSMKGS